MKNIKSNIKNLFLGSVLATTVVACVDLDVNPPAAIGPDDFWKTEQDAWYGLNACYALMPGCDVYMDAHADNAFNHHGHESAGQAVQTASLNATRDAGYNYENIRRSNIFIQNVETCVMSEDLKTRMKAEARFFRANTYVSLNLNFGKVAIITEVLDYDAASVARNSVEEVQKFVMDELNAIINILPESYAGGYMNEKGRITKWAALALKARTALYWGQYDVAEAAAKEIMNGKQFSLFKLNALTETQQKEADQLMKLYVDENALEAAGTTKEKFLQGLFSYEGLWHTEYANLENPEYILARQYKAGNIDYTDYVRFLALRPDQMGGGWASVEPIQDLVDTYWDHTGKQIPTPLSPAVRSSRYEAMLKAFEKADTTLYEFVKTDAMANADYNAEFKNRDARFYASILFPFKAWYETDMGEEFVYTWRYSNNDPKGGYVFRKIQPKTTATTQRAEGDYPVYRYAEILLTFAEASVQLSGWSTDVQLALNELRERCGMPNVPTALGKEEALEFIRNERRIELAGEGHRYYDLRRYGKEYAKKSMDMTMHSIDNNFSFPMRWEDKLMLMPIPQTAMDLNPLLQSDQNAGY